MRGVLLSTVMSLGLVITSASVQATSIGVNFVGGGNKVTGGVTMASTDSAGVVPQTNWNNETTGSGSGITGLIDSTGATVAGLTLTYAGQGTYDVGQTAPVGGDQKLNDGFIYGNTTVTVSGIPYPIYNLYIYELNDAAGRVEQTYLNGNTATSVYGQAASPTDANHVSGSANTYLYTQSVDTSGSGTPGGDYVLFGTMSGSSVSFSDTAPGNGYLNGFEIVAAPEPASCAILGFFSLGLLARRRISK